MSRYGISFYLDIWMMSSIYSSTVKKIICFIVLSFFMLAHYPVLPVQQGADGVRGLKGSKGEKVWIAQLFSHYFSIYHPDYSHRNRTKIYEVFSTEVIFWPTTTTETFYFKCYYCSRYICHVESTDYIQWVQTDNVLCQITCVNFTWWWRWRQRNKVWDQPINIFMWQM